MCVFSTYEPCFLPVCLWKARVVFGGVSVCGVFWLVFRPWWVHSRVSIGKKDTTKVTATLEMGAKEEIMIHYSAKFPKSSEKRAGVQATRAEDI